MDPTYSDVEDDGTENYQEEEFYDESEDYDNYSNFVNDPLAGPPREPQQEEEETYECQYQFDISDPDVEVVQYSASGNEDYKEVVDLTFDEDDISNQSEISAQDIGTMVDNRQGTTISETPCPTPTSTRTPSLAAGESIFQRIPGTDQILCKVCQKMVKSRKHRFVHRPGTYICPYCPCVYTRGDNLSAHIKVKHTELPSVPPAMTQRAADTDYYDPPTNLNVSSESNANYYGGPNSMSGDGKYFGGPSSSDDGGNYFDGSSTANNGSGNCFPGPSSTIGDSNYSGGPTPTSTNGNGNAGNNGPVRYKYLLFQLKE